MIIQGPCELKLDGETLARGEAIVTTGADRERIRQMAGLGQALGNYLRTMGRLPGKKATRRMQREAAAKARDEATAQRLRELATDDPAALTRALGMARFDLAVCPRHPAARRLLAIAAAEGIG